MWRVSTCLLRRVLWRHRPLWCLRRVLWQWRPRARGNAPRGRHHWRLRLGCQLASQDFPRLEWLPALLSPLTLLSLCLQPSYSPPARGWLRAPQDSPWLALALPWLCLRPGCWPPWPLRWLQAPWPLGWRCSRRGCWPHWLLGWLLAPVYSPWRPRLLCRRRPRLRPERLCRRLRLLRCRCVGCSSGVEERTVEPAHERGLAERQHRGHNPPVVRPSVGLRCFLLRGPICGANCAHCRCHCSPICGVCCGRDCGLCRVLRMLGGGLQVARPCLWEGKAGRRPRRRLHGWRATEQPRRLLRGWLRGWRATEQPLRLLRGWPEQHWRRDWLLRGWRRATEQPYRLLRGWRHHTRHAWRAAPIPRLAALQY